MEAWQLAQLQSMSLDAQMARSSRKIREFYGHYHGDVYASISGRDSAVMLAEIRKIFPDVVAVYIDTGLEHPAVRDFIKTIENVVWLKPKMNFKEVIEKYGFPVPTKENAQKISEIRTTKSAKLLDIRMNGRDNKYKSGKLPEKWRYLIDAPFKISHKCCDVMKKRPAAQFEKETGLKMFVGTMAGDSKFRRQSWMRHSCNAYDLKRPHSAPLSCWTHAHILEYVERFNLPIPSCYPEVEHTGCLFCGFALDFDPAPNRFQVMKRTLPAQHNYCINKLGMGKVLDFMGVKYE